MMDRQRDPRKRGCKLYQWMTCLCVYPKSTGSFSYLEEPLNPYIADYDKGLQGHSELETRHWYCQERDKIIKRSDWRSQRDRRHSIAPTDDYVRTKCGLLQETRNIARDSSCRGPENQKLINDKVIPETIKVVIASSTTIQEADVGTLPCIFYIHGGGRYGGTPYSGGFLERAKRWANHFNAIIISVDYRLSPNELDESPTGEEPTNDCFDALKWVYDHLGTNDDRVLRYGDQASIIVYGTSAGGGLAASTVMKWCQKRRQGSIAEFGELHGLVLEAPQLDDRCNTQSHEEFKRGNMFSSADAVEGWNASLGSRRGASQVSIFEAPARASHVDVQGFPPTYIEVGTAEPFRDEVKNFYNTLRSAEVEVEMKLWKGGFHGFFAAEPNATISKLCVLTKLRWLGQRFDVHSTDLDREYYEVKKAYDDKVIVEEELAM
ncbi:Alpha/Beta hydrolase protein [Astrocystis sublimbata]|nr:Alpha/Beta hydrolase protein [Astrocystis sublimbata]